MKHVIGARCTICGHLTEALPGTTVCPDCGGILDIEYDYDYIRSKLTKYDLMDRTDRTMWRYMEFLPVEGRGERPRLRVGGSPLYEADRLGKMLGIKKLYIKDDGQNPTASLKDRASAMAVIKAGEAEMVQNVFELDEKEAGDIMTHRTNIVALDGEMTLNEAVAFIRNEANNSRFPVYKEDIDHIIGILHIRDVLNFSEEAACREQKLCDIEGLLRKPNFIPEIRKIDQLFHEMQAQKSHMEIVVDEYGQTAGIVTLEDILEEIVGNIEDEYDEEEKLIVRRSDGTWLLDGMAPLADVTEKLGFAVEEKDLENFETLSGFLIAKLDRIPEEGEKPVIACCGWIFKIRQVGGKTIRTVVAAPGRRAVKN